MSQDPLPRDGTSATLPPRRSDLALPPNPLVPVKLADLSESLDSISSTSVHEDHDGPAPLAYHESTDRHRRASTTGRRTSFASSFSVGGLAVQALRNTLSRTSFDSGPSFNSLSRYSTAKSVKEIYGDLSQTDIRIMRTATRNTILDSLVNRVQSSTSESKAEPRYVRYARAGEEEADGTKLEPEEDEIGLYEQMPDVPVPAKDFGGEFVSIDPELVTWEDEDDPEYPRNWSTRQKVFQTAIVSIYTLISPMSSSILSPAMDTIAKDFHMHGQFLPAFSVSVMVLAWAIGPLMIAPMSESDRFGRRPVLNVSIWIIFVFNLACGFAKNTTQLCVFRFLGGLGGCASLNVGAGTLADLWSDDERLFAMAAYSISPTLGPVLSPVISSFIAQNLDWRWLFYVLAIFNGAVAIFGTIFFKETYSPRLLKIKANVLRKETGNEHLHTIYEIADGETNWGKFYITISRPVMLLFTHPMVIGLGAFMAFVYGFMYLMLVTFPNVFRESYGFLVGISGLMYLPMGIGYVIGTVFWTWAINRVFKRLEAQNGGVLKPEYRLPCLCFSGIGIPVGLIWYGWSAQKQLHWIMPSIGLAIFAFSFIAVFQTIQNYLIDMNNRFAASAVAAAAVFRSFFGFAFPLFSHAMYARLNYGWGNTMCAFIGLALGLPFPIFCLMYGERLRLWANRRMERQQAKRDTRNLERLQRLNAEAGAALADTQ